MRSPRRGTRLAAAVLAAALAVLLSGALSGCARVLTALAVQPNDTVSGEIVIATPARNDADTGPPLNVPPELADDVTVRTYKVDDYVGSRVLFDGLTFTQLNNLGSVSNQARGRYDFSLRRVGDRVLVAGKIDLTSIGVDRADFQLKISFPGRVVDSNGDEDGGTVSWTFTPGQVNDVSATVTFDDPQAPSVLLWTFILGVAVAGTAGGIVLLARRDRDAQEALSER